MSAVRLDVRSISKSFGSNHVLKGLSLSVAPGEIHAILGENGAGKSTLIKTVAGVHMPESGELLIDGEPFKPRNPLDAINCGIATVFQEFTLVSELSVAENILLGELPTRIGSPVLDRAHLYKRARELADIVGLEADVRTRVGTLPRSLQQLVEVAKAVGREARLFIFDEPTASLTKSETDKLFDVIRKLAAEGAGVIYITHRMHEIDDLTTRVSVLRDGEITFQSDTQDADHDELLRAMTGRDLGTIYPELPAAGEEPVVRVRDLQLREGGDGLALEVAEGEILGIAGLLNSGKDCLARVIGGVEAPRAGTVQFTNSAPRRRYTAGVARREGVIYYPSDRKREGLVLGAPIYRNITMGALQHSDFSLSGVLRRRAERRITSGYAHAMTVSPPDVMRTAGQLSGGNQQKVVLARGLTEDYRLHVFHDPTVGVDVGARTEVYRHIVGLAEKGCAIVLVSSDLSEVLAMSHRVAVVRDGNVVAVLTGEQRTSRAALGHFFGADTETDPPRQRADLRGEDDDNH